MTISLDHLQGMFLGAFLGDALGAPHEFDRSRLFPYTGKLQYPVIMQTRWQGERRAPIGSITDDTEMSLALLRSLVKEQSYQREAVIKAYLNWANSGGWMMGKNTRALFKGVTTVRGYSNRLTKVLALPEEERSQSNGPLMRATPLALLADLSTVITDTTLTNPHPIVVEANLLYVRSLRRALQGYTAKEILTALFSEVKGEEALEALNDRGRDLRQQKGWCLHGLYVVRVALELLLQGKGYSEIMQWVIGDNPGSDTDTNACIVGGLLGALIGRQALEEVQRENLRLLLNSQHDSRPNEYRLIDFDELTLEAYRLFCAR